MNTNIISNIFLTCFHEVPLSIQRCGVGIGNYVYIVENNNTKYIVRCSMDCDAYVDTIYWLNKLSALDIPTSKVLFHGKYEKYNYLICTFLEGEDIGLVYQNLSKKEKRKIAKEVIAIQNKVSDLSIEYLDGTWSWMQFIDDMLERADKRITQNGYFDREKVERIKEQKNILAEYFSNVEPVAYLDDISTKNLLIFNGQVSGVIDIDWMGIGDSLTFIALTYVALLNMDCETDYVEYLLQEKGCNNMEKKAFLFYSLLYCVDFMGERGSTFGDKRIDVNEQIVDRLNQIYEMLWKKWSE